MNVIPSGEAERHGKTVTVTIDHVGVFVRDSFDFNGDRDLGYWGRLDVALPPKWIVQDISTGVISLLGGVDVERAPPGVEFAMSNSVYRRYRRETGMGADFVIYSDVKSHGLIRPVRFTYHTSLP